MANLKKLLNDMIQNNPELKKMNDEGNQFKEERKQFYLNHGYDEETAVRKSWADYWTKAEEDYGVEFSIVNVTEDQKEEN